MRRIVSVILLSLVSIVVVPSCGTPEGLAYEDSWEVKYKHSFDFLWEESIKALKTEYEIAEANRDTSMITTEWRTQMGVFATFGYRVRLIVTLGGDVVEGYTVDVKEEQEVNTEQKDPLSVTEAEWEPSEADGGSAAKFRVHFHRRLNPKEGWREDEER